MNIILSYVSFTYVCNETLFRDIPYLLNQKGVFTRVSCRNEWRTKYFGTVRITLQYTPPFWSQMHPVDTRINAYSVVQVKDKTLKICLNLESCESYPYKLKYETKIQKNLTINITVAYMHNMLGLKNNRATLLDKTLLVKIFYLLKEKFDFRTQHVQMPYDVVRYINKINVLKEKILQIPCAHVSGYDIVSSAVSETSAIFIIKAAESLDKSIALLKPFSPLVWIFTGVSILLLTLSLFLLFSSEAKMKCMKAPKLFNVFWIVARCFLRQDIEIESIRLKTKYMILGIWMLMAFVLSSGYLGILPSFLIFPGEEVIPHNFVELFEAVKHHKYEMDTIHHSPPSFLIGGMLFLKQKNEMFEFMRSYFYKHPFDSFRNASHGLQSVLNEKTCLLASRNDIKQDIQAFGQEKFFVSTDILYTEYNYFCMEETFPYIYEFRKTINIIHQSGIAEKLQNDQEEDIRRKREFYEPVEVKEDDELKLEHVIGPLYLLLVGYLLSIIILIIELVFYYGKICLSHRKLKNFRNSLRLKIRIFSRRNKN